MINSYIEIGNKGNGSLGDCLYLTCIFRYFKHGRIILHNDEQCKQVGQIYENLCDVEYSDNPPERPDNLLDLTKEPFVSVHRTRKILYSLGIANEVSVPFLKLTNQEKKWAFEKIRKFDNPIVVVNDNSGTWDKTNIRANYVCPPAEKMQKIVDQLCSLGYTPLQFGRKEDGKFRKLNNTIPMRGYSIREMAALYSQIGKYSGGDTGDYHLMLAVGGICNVFHPNESYQLGYLCNDLFYKKENFENNVLRVKYINYNSI